MIEQIISQLSLYDVFAIVSVACVAYSYLRSSKKTDSDERAYVKVASNDRLYTILYNKFRDNIFSDNKWRVSPFITVESVFRKRRIVPEFPSSREPKTDKFEVYEPSSGQTQKWTVIDNLEEKLQNSDADVKNLRDVLWRTEDDAEIDEKLFENPKLAEEHFQKRSAQMMHRRTRFREIRQTVDKQPIYFKVYFTIPWFAQYQMRRFIRQLTELKLTYQQKEDLLVKLYWREEERKLGCT